MLNLINKVTIVIVSILLLGSCVSDDSPIVYDGLRMYPITQLKEPTETKDEWMSVQLSYHSYSRITPTSTLSIEFSISGKNRCPKEYVIKKDDLYLLKADGTKIYPKIHLYGHKFEDITFEFFDASGAFGRYSGCGKNAFFPVSPKDIASNGTKLVIAKIYYKDTVVMQNIEYGFDIYTYKQGYKVNGLMQHDSLIMAAKNRIIIKSAPEEYENIPNKQNP